MKVAILRVGYRHFACPSVQIATKLVDLFSKVVQVDQRMVGNRHVYVPVDSEHEHQMEVELTLIDSDLVEKRLKRVPQARRLGPGEPTMPPIDPGFCSP